MLDTIVIALMRGASHVPEALVRAPFLLAADAAWLARTTGVRQLERNLRHVIAHRDGTDAVDRAGIRRLSRRAMRSYFSYFSEALSVGARSRGELLARIRPDGDGFAPLRRLIHDHPGSAPMAMGHQGNWDYAGFWAHDALAPVTTVAERLSNRAMLDAFVAIRERLGMTILLTGQQGLTERLKRAMAEPHVLVPLLADRDLGPRGEFVRAFGSTIRVARGPATLAYDLHTPLFVANIHRETLTGERRRRASSSHGYVIRITGPLDIDRFRTLPRHEAIAAITQAWVDRWAAGVEDHPEDWHMLQPIFLEDLDLDRLRDVPADVLARVRDKALGSDACADCDTRERSVGA
ncbi:phosphatidylinositol mannoside acyltransferase [Bifidobacterium mongoliense]|uniref:phosphatidylinositol mannoside acyltransferase n=1 Tax=Bifidobacterium mongoliense TaxID=518643 RepID=UPI002A755335|nr:phosphatidylinositol mannoside acyltransferase [Bifidobacterium mongoliense]MDY3126255.1 phosphatidylinositol mannoside acyltransferase [Bifidobacterium mongoliense]